MGEKGDSIGKQTVSSPRTYAGAEEEVLRLDVAVDDVLGVAVLEGARHLQDELCVGGVGFCWWCEWMGWWGADGSVPHTHTHIYVPPHLHVSY